MINKPIVAIIIPPHAEPSLPMLGAAQLLGYAKRQGISATCYDFSLYAKTGGVVLPYRADTEGEYWKSVNIHKQKFTERYATLFPFFTANWDGCDQGNFRWNSFDDQKEYLRCQRENSNLTTFFNSTFSEFYANDYFLISVTFPSQLLDALLLADCIRKQKPEAVIVFGGGLINSCIQTPNDIRGPLSEIVDFISLGEGEFLLEIISRYSISDIKKLFSKKCAGISYIIDSAVIQKKLNLNILLSPPAFSNLQFYDTPLPVLPYRLSSVCYWNRCSFCTEHSYQSALLLPAINDHVNNLISLKNEYQTCYFMLQDSAVHPIVLNRFCDLLIQSGAKLKWGINARFDEKLTDDLLEKMYTAGCIFLRFGMESGSERILQLMNKGISIKESQRILKKTKQIGILTHLYFIVNFPGENDKDRELTKNFILNDDAFPDSFNISTFISYKIAPINGAMKKCTCSDAGWNLYEKPLLGEDFRFYIDEIMREFEKKHPLHKTLLSPAHTITLYEKTRKWQ